MHGTGSVNALTKLQSSLVLFFRKKHYLQYYKFFCHSKLSCAFSLRASVQYLRDTTSMQKAYFSNIAKDFRWNYFRRRVPSFISDRVINMAANRLCCQPVLTCSKLIIETLEKGMKYVQR